MSLKRYLARANRYFKTLKWFGRKHGDQLIDIKEVSVICDVGQGGFEIISRTAFQSQNEFSHRRGLKIAHVINDFFEEAHFKGKRILELGPGHYGFALLARSLEAEVSCVERDPAFVALGRYLGFEVIDMDFNALCADSFPTKFDGLWVKGTFNACNHASDQAVEAFVSSLTSLVAPAGWAWLVTVNKTSRQGPEGDEFLRHRIEVQRRAFERHGWSITPIAGEDRGRYGLSYSGSYYVYTRNIPRYRSLSERRAVGNGHAAQGGRGLPEATSKEPGQPQGSQDKGRGQACHENKAVHRRASLSSRVTVSRDNPFNKVFRAWKPTLEYLEDPWRYFTDFVDIAKRRQARFITMSQALEGEYDSNEINVLLDHHIDYYPIETEVMCRWEKLNGVVSSVYLFARYEYDEGAQKKKWSIEDLNVPFYQGLEREGFEIGYHQNAVGLVRNREPETLYTKHIDDDDIAAAQKVFAEDVDRLRKHFNIRTLIPHGAGEGNVQLTEYPPGYDDIVWVYNNAKRNGRHRPPLKWRNYSDSSGIEAQRIVGYGGQYIARVDNLHLNAYLLSRGLNHVLIHAGRYSKGMPYEMYDTRGQPVASYAEGQQLFGLKRSELPLRSSRLMQEWLDQRGESVSYRTNDRGSEKYYVYSDDIELLKSHVASSDWAIPFKVIHRALQPEERSYYRVPRPVTREFHLPTAEEEFESAFKGFFNILFSPSVLEHLAYSDVPLDVVVLREVAAHRMEDAELLVQLLRRAPQGAQIDMTVRLQVWEPRTWHDRLMAGVTNEGLDARFSFTCSESQSRVIVIRDKGERFVEGGA